MSNRHSHVQTRRGEVLVVLFLIFFVLLSLFMTAFVWYLYVDQEDYRARTLEAEKMARTLDEDCNWYKFQVFMLREYIGMPPDVKPELAIKLNIRDEERKRMLELRDKFDKKDLGKEEHKYRWVGICTNPECAYSKEKGNTKKMPFDEPTKELLAEKPGTDQPRTATSNSALSLATTTEWFQDMDAKRLWGKSRDNKPKDGCGYTLYDEIKEANEKRTQSEEGYRTVARERDKAREEASKLLREQDLDIKKHAEEMKKLTAESAKQLSDFQVKYDELLKKYDKLSQDFAELRSGRIVQQGSRDQEEILALKKELAELRTQRERDRTQPQPQPQPQPAPPLVPQPQPQPQPPPLAVAFVNVLNTRCAGCHTGATAKKGVQIMVAPGVFNTTFDRQRILKALDGGKMPLNPATMAPYALPAEEAGILRQVLSQPVQR